MTSSSHRPFEFYVASDLHFGANARGNRSVEALARHVCEHPADALLLGGDLGGDPQTLAICLQLFDRFEGVKMAVPGNHDVWLNGWPTQSSWALHEDLLPRVFEAFGFHPLHLKPLLVDTPEGPLGFVGSMGWYDYSFRDDIGADLSHYRAKTPPWGEHPIWNDARYARFPDFDDESLCALLNERLAAQLAAVEAPRVVALVHHLVTKALLVHPRFIVPRLWRFANAFLGSERLGDTLRADARVKQVFCGHIHMERSARWDHAHVTALGGDYLQKQLIRASAELTLDKRMFSP